MLAAQRLKTPCPTLIIIGVTQKNTLPVFLILLIRQPSATYPTPDSPVCHPRWEWELILEIAGVGGAACSA